MARALLRPGTPIDDAVGRRQGGGVELDRGVDDAGRGVREQLELAVMRRCDRERALVEQVLQQGTGERGAFCGVACRRRAHREGRGARAGALQQGDDVAQVAAERRERLLDALLVADVGQHLFEDGQMAAGSRREPAGRTAPSGRAGRPSSSATVLPPVFGPVISRTRSSPPMRRVIGTGAPSSGWRASTRLSTEGAADQPALQGRLRHQAKAGPWCRAASAPPRDGRQRGRGRARRDTRRWRRCLRRRVTDDAAETAQDALDLALLFDLQLTPGVRKVDDGERLDEQRGAAGGDVVDDAADLAAEVGLDRHDVAAVAQGDDRLPGRRGGRSARRETPEAAIGRRSWAILMSRRMTPSAVLAPSTTSPRASMAAG